MQDLDIRGAGNMLGAEQSGFIADLGYDTYQKILNEAVLELKNDEFADLYADEPASTGTAAYVTDCQVETDMELMFPGDYVENVPERMSLYRELDSIEREDELLAFERRLIRRPAALRHAKPLPLQAARAGRPPLHRLLRHHDHRGSLRRVPRD